MPRYHNQASSLTSFPFYGCLNLMHFSLKLNILRVRLFCRHILRATLPVRAFFPFSTNISLLETGTWGKLACLELMATTCSNRIHLYLIFQFQQRYHFLPSGDNRVTNINKIKIPPNLKINNTKNIIKVRPKGCPPPSISHRFHSFRSTWGGEGLACNMIKWCQCNTCHLVNKQPPARQVKRDLHDLEIERGTKI